MDKDLGVNDKKQDCVARKCFRKSLSQLVEGTATVISSVDSRKREVPLFHHYHALLVE